MSLAAPKKREREREGEGQGEGDIKGVREQPRKKIVLDGDEDDDEKKKKQCRSTFTDEDDGCVIIEGDSLATGAAAAATKTYNEYIQDAILKFGSVAYHSGEAVEAGLFLPRLSDRFKGVQLAISNEALLASAPMALRRVGFE